MPWGQTQYQQATGGGSQADQRITDRQNAIFSALGLGGGMSNKGFNPSLPGAMPTYTPQPAMGTQPIGGNASPAPGMGSGGMPQPFTPTLTQTPNVPYLSTAQQFNNAFGGLTTQQVMANRAQGKVPGGEVPENSREPSGWSAPPGIQGGAAAKANSLMPGMFSGNTMPGAVPANEGIPSGGTMPSAPAAQQPQQEPMQVGAQSAAPQGPAAMPDAGPMAAASSVDPTAAAAPDAGPMAAAAPTAQKAGNGSTQPSWSELPASVVSKLAGKTLNQAAEYLRNHGYAKGEDGKWRVPGSQTPTDPVATNRSDWDQWLGRVGWNNIALPDAKLSTPVTIPVNGTEPPNIVSVMASIPDKNLAQLAGKVHSALYNDYGGLLAMAEANGGYGVAAVQEQIAKAKRGIEILNAYGINFDPLTPLLNQLSGQGGGSGGGNGTGNGSGGGGGGTGGGTNPDTGLPDEGGIPDSDYTGGLGSDINLPDNEYTRYFNRVKADWNKLSGDDQHKQFLLEYMQALADRADARDRQQQGVNVLADSLKGFQNDPLRGRAMQLSGQMLDDPTGGVDYEGIKNRYVSDQDATTQELIRQMSAGASRRGLAPGAIEGMATRTLSDQGNRTNRGLGELETERQRSELENKYRAITNAGSMSQLYTGGDAQMKQILANAIMGTPQAAQNPYAGWSNNYTNYQTLRELQSADDGSGFGWEDGLGMLGSLGGKFLGTEAGAGALAGLFGGV